MNWWSLTIKDPKLEQTYSKDTFKFSKILTTIILVILFLIYLISAIRMSNTNNTRQIYLAILSILFLISAIIFIKSKSHRTINSIIHIFITLSTTFVFTSFVDYIFKKAEQEDFKLYPIYFGMLFSLVIEICFTISQYRTVLIQQIGVIVIVLGNLGYSYSSKTMLLYYMVMYLIRILVFYMKERYLKKIYLEIEENREELKIWKHFMMNVSGNLTVVLKKNREKQRNPNAWEKFWRLFRKNKEKILRNSENEEIFQEKLGLWVVETMNSKAKNEFGENGKEKFVKWLEQMTLENEENLVEIFDDYILEREMREHHIKKIGYIKNDGKEENFFCEVHNFLWKDDNIVLFQANNITAEEKVKYLIEIDKYKDQVLASVTHDLRTPLNGIKYMSKRAQNNFKEKNEKEFEKCIRMLNANADLLYSLISDILDSSQIKQNKLRINLEEFNLNKLVEEVAALMRIQTELKQIGLEVKNCIHESTIIKSDEKRLKQILINLISNSVKFTSEGYIIIKIEDSEKYEDAVKFSIIDTGIGIKEEVIPQLFKPFCTFDNQNLNKNGIGIGLNICKTLVNLLGPKNSIEIESEYGHGAKFSFLINLNTDHLLSPRAKDNTLININSLVSLEGNTIINNIKFTESITQFDEFSQYHKKININLPKISNYFEPIKISEKKKLNIIIADDNVFNLFALEEMINSEKYFEKVIYKASHGGKVVEIFKEKNKNYSEDNIDLIILDVEMPIMNGYEAFKMLQKLIFNEKYQMSFIGFHTGHDSKSIEIEPHFILEKPVKKKKIDKLFCELTNLI